MCLASKYLNQLENVVKEMDCDYKKLSAKQSEYDNNMVELYHKIETTNFNACEGYYFTKQLQEILRKRRSSKTRNGKIKFIKRSSWFKKIFK